MRRFFIIGLLLVAACNRTRSIDPPKPTIDDQEKPAPPSKEPGKTPKQSAKAPNDNLPVAMWKADAKLLEQLDAPVELGGFTVRPPKGYSKIATKSAAFPQMHWNSPSRKDALQSSLLFSVAPLPDAKNPKYAPETVITDGIALFQKITESWTQSEVEHGTLGGIAFVRIRYAGAYLGKNWAPMRGVYYAAHDGTRLVQLHLNENIAEGKVSFLDLLHTAAMTLKKK